MAQQLAVEFMLDTRLSPDARVLGWFIRHRTKRGPVEISTVEFADMLGNQTGLKRVQAALGQLARLGYLVRRRGGRGHHDSYAFTYAETAQLKMGAGKDSYAETAQVNEHLPTPKSTSYPPDSYTPSDQVSVSYAETAQVNAASRAATHPHARSHAVDLSLLTDNNDEDDDVVGAHAIAPDAEKALTDYGDLFRGCRGALRDYLHKRVDAGQHYGYVQTMAMWLNGARPVFRLPDGDTLDRKDQPRWLAAALNDLAGSDERRGHSRPVGDPANLQRKLSVLLEDDWNARHPGTWTNRPSRTDGRSEGTLSDQSNRRRRDFGAE